MQLFLAGKKTVQCRKRLPHSLHPSNASNPIRIALYSHDTMGLGHKRRNLLIAQTLARSLPQASILLISGMEEARSTHLPSNIDYLSLPALHKNSDGQYQSRRLEVPLHELIAIRSQVIQAAMQAFAPDLLIVDNTKFINTCYK